MTSASACPGSSPGPGAFAKSFPDLDPAQIPMAAPVSRRESHLPAGPHWCEPPLGCRAARRRLYPRLQRAARPMHDEALELPWTPAFLHKHGGLVLSMGQFMQWVGAQVQWPPARCKSGQARRLPKPLIDDHQVTGVRLMDQGVDKQGRPAEGFMPGMDIRAALTVVGDGPGRVGRPANRLSTLACPKATTTHDWAVGMKFVVDLPENTHSQARHRSAYVRLPGTGNFRFSLCPPGPGRFGRDFCPLVVR